MYGCINVIVRFFGTYCDVRKNPFYVQRLFKINIEFTVLLKTSPVNSRKKLYLSLLVSAMVKAIISKLVLTL